jgi:Flp pilus assembly protein TadD
MAAVSAFLVDPNAVVEASVRLGSVAAGVEEVHGRLGRHLGAATGTPAAGAVDDLLARFSIAFGEFALAGAELSRAVGGAASEYHRTDSAVAAACDARGAGEGGRRT